jgi:hypothetical protein
VPVEGGGRVSLRCACHGVAEARLDRDQRVQRPNWVATVVQRRRRSVREHVLEFAQRHGIHGATLVAQGVRQDAQLLAAGGEHAAGNRHRCDPSSVQLAWSQSHVDEVGEP